MPQHHGLVAVSSHARGRGIGRRRVVTGLGLVGAWAALGRLAPDLSAPGSAAVRPPTDADAGTAAAAASTATLTRRRATSDELGPRVPPMARVDGLDVALPATEAVLVAFHEASRRGAVGMRPVGVLVGNDNATRFDPPPDEPTGVPYLVQVSRGRRPAPTSAVDVVLADDQPVLAPVAATVTEVSPYLLYGRHPDLRVELAPESAPGTAVVLLHVEDAAVRVGDRVAPGDLLAARARRLPFASTVDAATAPDRLGHVHLEVRRT